MLSLRSRFLRVLVGKHWRGFAGLDSDELAALFTQALEEQSLAYTHSEETPSISDKVGYGTYKDKQVFVVQTGDEEITIEIIPAYADPVTRGVFLLFTTEERIESMKNISILDIQPVTDTTTQQIRDVIEIIIDRSPRPLWDCTHHPRFVTGVILQRKTRFLWRYWIKPL